MPQMTLYAPDISCEHCIATIERVIGTVHGARFLHGDPNAREFAVELERGAVLDELEAVLSSEGYPLGDAPPLPGAGVKRLELMDLGSGGMAGMAQRGAATAGTHPTYRVTRTEAGADVNYDCPCSCTAGFAFDRGSVEQAPESCCCGRQMLVGRDAESRLRAALDDPQAYVIDVQQVAMPWGQPLDVALAVPQDA